MNDPTYIYVYAEVMMYEWAYPTICGKLLGDRIKNEEACEASC